MNVANDEQLLPLALDMAGELFALTDTNRSYLRRWLPWLDETTCKEDTEKFIHLCIQKSREVSNYLGQDFTQQYAVMLRGKICGVAGFVSLPPKDTAAIGYWLAKDFCGRGIMLRVCQKLLALAFTRYGLKQIEIRCAVGNSKSRAIPERLGFAFNAILPQNEFLYDHYVDHAVYSMLQSEYAATETASL